MFSHRTAVTAALAFWVFATRAWLIFSAGSVVPFWDQWDVEAAGLYPGWIEGTLSWSQLVASHNEHRIVLTHLADLALFVVTGGWNPWLQLILNAILHAITAALIAFVFWPAFSSVMRSLFVFVLALIFASTAGWQNALWGFQSQVYFGSLLTVGAIAGLCGHQALTRHWWFGLVAALLVLFTNAGGLSASVAALVVNGGLLVMRVIERWRCTLTTKRAGMSPAPMLSQNRSFRASFAGLCLIAGVVVIGIMLRVDVPYHAPLHAKSISQFGAVFLRCLAWPHVNEPLLAVLMQLPLLWFVLDHFQRRHPLGTAARCALALVLFGILHAAAVAYSRGAGLLEFRPLSRYQDPLLLGTAAQAYAGIHLALRYGRVGRLALMSWIALLVSGLIILTETNFTLNFPYKRAQDAASLTMVREYVHSGDARVFTRDANFTGPHPDSRVVMRILDDPRLRRVVPAPLLTADDQVNSTPIIIRRGAFITAVAAFLLLATLLWTAWAQICGGLAGSYRKWSQIT